MKLNECTIANIPSMVNQSIDFSLPFGMFRRMRADEVAITMSHRLAHLIMRMETSNNSDTAVGAKWYLQHMALAPISEYQSVLQPFVDKLTGLLSQFEATYGVVDPDILDKLIYYGNAKISRERVLYGQPITYITGTCFGSPYNKLAAFISYEMWRQNIHM
jgi:hypothetical protein